MAEVNVVRSLVAVLQERETGLGLDDVAWAFESTQTKDNATVWTLKYINEETLLTEDEHKLHQWLRKTGYSSAPADKSIKTILDSDLKRTLSALESSTAAIERQSRLLENQRDTLLQFQKQRRGATAAAQNTRLKIRGQRLHETSRLGFMIEELEDEVKGRLDDITVDLDHAIQSLSSSTSESIVAHDRVLDILAPLATKTRGIDSTIKPSEVDTYCRRLIEFRTSEMRSRFDLFFQEQLLDCAENTHDDACEPSPTDYESLTNEHQTLREEIANVIEVVVASDVRQPLLKSMRSAASRSKEKQFRWSEYIFSTLKHMIAQTQVLHEHLSGLLDYESAIREIQTIYNSSPPAKEGSMVVTDPRATSETPQPRPLLTSTLSGPSTMLVGAAGAGKAKELAMSQVMSRLNITASNNATDAAIQPWTLLEQAVETALDKLAAQYDYALSADKIALSTSLSERDDESAIVRDKLFAFTEYNKAHSADQDLARKIDNIDDRIKRIADDYATADASTRSSMACEGAGKLRGRYG